jgi:hypothetical protein
MVGFLYRMTLLLVFLSSSFKPHAQVLPANPGERYRMSDTAVWNKMDLASAAMKPRPARFPWWIPATIGGAAATAGTLWWILSDHEPSPVALPDTFDVPCGESRMIFPMANDTGRGLRISEVAGLDPGTITWTSQFIAVSDQLRSSITFTYFIQDENGKSASATVFLRLLLQDIVLPDQTWVMEEGQDTVGNILQGAQCSQCQITTLSTDPDTSLVWSPSGEITFTAPEGSSGKSWIVTFTVTDLCGQLATGLLTLHVIRACRIEPEFTILPDVCQTANGSIAVQFEEPDLYTYTWSTGGSGPVLSDLSGGQYGLTITLIADTTCYRTFSLDVPFFLPPLELADDVYEVVAGQMLAGNVLNNDTGTSMEVINYTPVTGHLFEWDPDGSFRFQSDADFSGEIEVFYTVQDTCGRTAQARLLIRVLSNPCQFSISVSTTPADCGKRNGTATVMLTPPAGNYGIRWSDGSTGSSVSGLSPGMYGVSVTDLAMDCTLLQSFSIDELPPVPYIAQTSITHPTCLGGGEIQLVLVSPHGGSLRVEVSREGENLGTWTVQMGTLRLSTLIAVLPGTYTVLVYESDSEPRCGQSISLTLVQEDLFLKPEDDRFEIPGNGFWEGNVLANDEGTGLKVVTFSPPMAGNANVNSDGTAFYFPNPGFVGLDSFPYTVRDTCGQTEVAWVVIRVLPPDCDYTVTFSVTPADCGLSNGMVTATHSPPDPLDYYWSNGEIGMQMTGVPSGNYTLTIFNPVLGCSQEFEVFVPENPPSYILQEEIVMPNCRIPANVFLEFGGMGPLTMILESPVGDVTTHTTPPGWNSMSDYVDLIPGVWRMVLYNEQAGPDCAVYYDFFIDQAAIPILELVQITPPSGPSSQDGTIQVRVFDGVEPYRIWVNGNLFGIFPEGLVTITGVGEGFYEIIALDAADCESNPLEILIVNARNGTESAKAMPSASRFGIQPVALPFLSNATDATFFPLGTRSGRIDLSRSVWFEIQGFIDPDRAWYWSAAVGQLPGYSVSVNGNFAHWKLTSQSVELGRQVGRNRWYFRNSLSSQWQQLQMAVPGASLGGFYGRDAAVMAGTSAGYTMPGLGSLALKGRFGYAVQSRMPVFDMTLHFQAPLSGKE